MAYFDSPKNRAMWEREMRHLRTERENRKNGISTATPVMREEMLLEEEKKDKTVLREATSFNELLHEETEETRMARKQRSREAKKELSGELKRDAQEKKVQKPAQKTMKKEKSKSLGG